MSSQDNAGDPLAFVRNMWGNMGFSLPGMVAPTLDIDELDKRISDLKAVEGWLRMNMSMLQMTIQSMEMQKTTLSAVKTMSQMVSNPDAERGGSDAFSQAAMWPWAMMQQMQTQMQEAAAQATPAPAAAAPAKTSKKTP